LLANTGDRLLDCVEIEESGFVISAAIDISDGKSESSSKDRGRKTCCPQEVFKEKVAINLTVGHLEENPI